MDLLITKKLYFQDLTEKNESKIQYPAKGNTLLQLDRLNENEMLISKNSVYYTVVKNGCLDVYKSKDFNRRNLIWSSKSELLNFKPPCYLYINFEGVLIVSDADKKVTWQSNNTEWKGVPTYSLTIQGDSFNNFQ
jgi:hypothetical protein